MEKTEIFAIQKKTLFEIPMSVGNKEKYLDFLREIKNKRLSITSQTNYINTFIVFSRAVKTDFDELSKADIYDYIDYLDDYTYVTQNGTIKHYAESTKRSNKVMFRAFLQYLKKDDLAGALVAGRTQQCRLPEDLLTKEEVDKLIAHADHPRDKALIATLYESGARLGEMLSCNLNHVSFDKNGCVLVFPSGKTGARRIRLVESQPYLRLWVLNNHPRKDEKDAPLWCRIKQPHTRYEQSSFSWILRTTAKKAGITKKVNPHAFRHARATHLAQHLTEQQLKGYLGWTAGSTMAATYVHLSGRDIDNAILSMHGIETEEAEKKAEKQKEKRCPRCKELLTKEDAQFCYLCGMPLNQMAEQDLGDTVSTMIATLFQAMETDPQVAERFKKIITQSSLNNQFI